MKTFFSVLLVAMTITEITGSFDVSPNPSANELHDFSLGSFSGDNDHSRLPASSGPQTHQADHITELTGTFK